MYPAGHSSWRSTPPRKSIFMESGLNSPKVAPAPIKFVNKPSEAFTECSIHHILKSIHLLMRFVGIFPIGVTEKGTFKLMNQWLAYCVVLFLGMVGYVAYIEWDKVEILTTQEGRFEEAVIDYLFKVYLLPIIINPLVWYEARKLVSVTNDWGFFEKTYNRVTKRKLDIMMGNKPIIVAVVLPLIACITMVVTHVTMAHFKIVQVIPYCYINSLIYLIGGFWYLQCNVLGKTATQIADDFHLALKNIGPKSQVADYRTLWMLLSKLTRDIGNSVGYTLTFVCLYLFLIITLTIYGLLSQLQTGFGHKDIGLTVNAALATAILFFICDEAHYASNCVKVQFQKKLLLVELTWMNDDVQQEINMFLRSTEMSPTDISVVGFFDVNRNLFKSLLATMVTYLVVLLQFQISIPEDGGVEMNVTAITTKITAVTTVIPK